MKKPLFACLFASVLLMLAFPWRSAGAEDDSYAYTIEEPGPAAENLTDQCRLTTNLQTASYSWRLTDQHLNTRQILKNGQWVSLSWSDDVPVKTVWLAFSDYPGAYLVRQLDGAGALIREDAGQSYVNHAVFVAEETRAVTVLSKGEISLCSLYAYGAGVVPGYHPWEPTPEKLDYLIVAMHPDDDVLFMGAILPLYTVEEGREGSVYYAATQDRVRKDEAGDGAWVMGLRTAPLLGAFPDIPPQYREQNEKYFTEAAVTQALVRLFRQYRPEVVFSHDLNGEYGHWQHKLLAGAVREAAKLAAKGYYDPQSVTRYGTWQVKKTYLHLYRRNQITLPVDKPIAAYGGLTPREIAAAALQRHVSQLSQNHTKAEGEAYDLSAFGLVYTAVGPDTPGLNDPFEHIDPAVLHCNPAPTPTFTPAPTFTLAPTDTPTPRESPTPTSTPAIRSEAILTTAAPSRVPGATPTAPPAVAEPGIDAAEAASPPSRWLPLSIGAAAFLCLGVSCLCRKRRLRRLLWGVALLLILVAIRMLASQRTTPARLAAGRPMAVSIDRAAPCRLKQKVIQ